MWRNLCIRRTVWKIKMCHINIRTIPDGKTNDNEAHKGKTWEKCKISEVLSYAVYVIGKSLENGEKKSIYLI